MEEQKNSNSESANPRRKFFRDRITQLVSPAILEKVQNLSQNPLTQSFVNELYKKSIFTFSTARAAQFALQGYLVPSNDPNKNKNYLNHLKLLRPKVEELLRKDTDNILQGLYPIEVLNLENPVKYLSRIPKLIWDAQSALKRKKNNVNKEFSQKYQTELEELPEYYQRNFHYQTNGYLSHESSDLYDHQVEVLFSGTANPMRRQIIPLIKSHLAALQLPLDGAGLNFLEVASGTGSLTQFLALAFPQAQITCVDLSRAYLKQAQEKLKRFSRVNYVQGAAEKLSFTDQKFDIVVSCYLFHELPENIRHEVLKESVRVTKVAGLVVAADSLQLGDDVELDWALEQFPQNYHEPFYKNYCQNPLIDIFDSVGLKNTQTDLALLTKIVTGVKV